MSNLELTAFIECFTLSVCLTGISQAPLSFSLMLADRQFRYWRWESRHPSNFLCVVDNDSHRVTLSFFWHGILDETRHWPNRGRLVPRPWNGK